MAPRKCSCCPAAHLLLLVPRADIMCVYGDDKFVTHSRTVGTLVLVAAHAHTAVENAYNPSTPNGPEDLHQHYLSALRHRIEIL